MRKAEFVIYTGVITGRGGGSLISRISVDLLTVQAALVMTCPVTHCVTHVTMSVSLVTVTHHSAEMCEVGCTWRTACKACTSSQLDVAN